LGSGFFLQTGTSPGMGIARKLACARAPHQTVRGRARATQPGSERSLRHVRLRRTGWSRKALRVRLPTIRDGPQGEVSVAPLLRHKEAGLPVVSYRDGKAVRVKAEDLGF